MCQSNETGITSSTKSHSRSQLLIPALSFVLFSQYALAEVALDRATRIDIPDGVLLRDALIRLASDAKMVVMMDTTIVQGRVADGIHGSFSTREALNRLLKSSGFVYTNEGDRIRIMPESTAIHTSLNEGTPALPVAELVAADDDNYSTKSAANSSEEQKSDLSVVLVTAQKHTERLQDVPVPVTAISGETLAKNNELRLEDYYTSIPGLSLAPINLGGAPNLAIRGITSGGLSNPTVGIMVDDVPYGSSTALGGGTSLPDLDPSDLARIEVLRGPQGTLYGASSIGGLFKYVTIDPSTEGLSGRIEGGSNWVYNGAQAGYNVRGAVNIPLSDTLAVRASAFVRQDPGYIDDPVHHFEGVNEGHADGGRLAALWRPADDVTLKVSALLQNNSRAGSPSSDLQLNALQLSTVPGSGGYNRQFQAYSAVLSAKVAGAELTLVSGYGVDTGSLSFDFTAPFGSALEQLFPGFGGAPLLESFKTKKFTEEARLSSSIGQYFDWLAGAFYTHESSDGLAIQYGANPDTGVVGGIGYVDSWPTTFEEYALFSDLTVHFTDRFNVQLGGRESENHQTYYEVIAGPLDPSFFGFSSPVINPPIDSRDNSFTYLVTPQFKVSPDLMIYSRIATGYRPGGPNPTATVYDVPEIFKPDRTTNYEIGSKGSVLHGVLSFDASVYYIDWKDIQLNVYVPSSGAGYYANGSRAKSQGLELSLQWNPFDGLSIATWVDWDKAIITESSPPGASPAFNVGERLPLSAPFSANLSAEDKFPISSAIQVFVGADASYLGDRLKNIGAEGPTVYPAFTRVNCRIGMRDNTVEASLFLNNVADTRGILGNGVGTETASVTYIQPRTVGLSVSKKF